MMGGNYGLHWIVPESAIGHGADHHVLSAPRRSTSHIDDGRPDFCGTVPVWTTGQDADHHVPTAPFSDR